MKHCRSEAASTFGWMFSVMKGLLFLRALAEQRLVLTNKNVMQGTMLRNDSINNEGDLSCTHHNLHFKAHIHTKSREVCSTSESNFHQGPQQSVRETDAPYKLTHLTYRLSLRFLRFDGIAAPAILQHPTQKSLNREQLKESWASEALKM